MLPMLEQSTTHEIKDTDNGTPIGSLQTHEKKYYNWCSMLSSAILRAKTMT